MLRRLFWFFVGFAIGGFGVVAADAYALSPVPPGMTAANVKVSAPSSMPRISFGPAGDVFIGNGSIPGSAVANRQIGAYIGSRSFGVDLSRYTPPSALARAGRIAMRATGVGAAVALGLEVLDLVFDEDTGGWQVPDETVPALPAGYIHTLYYNGASGGKVCTSAANQCTATDILYWFPHYQLVRNSTVVIPETMVLELTSSTRARIRYRFETPGGSAAATFNDLYVTGSTCPAGYVFVGDGMCEPSDAYRPATDAELEDLIEADTIARDRGGELLEALRQLGYLPDFEPLAVSGPSSVIGETTTTTTTSPAGTTTKTSTKTYNLDYSGDTITVTSSTTTTTTTPDGETITETETETPAPGGGVPLEEATPALCEQYPEISACQELGEPDEDFELPEEERDLEWQKELSAAGSCPAPIPLTIRGNTYMFSYEPACIGADYLRPIVIGIAWLSAGIFLFSTVRQS